MGSNGVGNLTLVGESVKRIALLKMTVLRLANREKTRREFTVSHEFFPSGSGIPKKVGVMGYNVLSTSE